MSSLADVDAPDAAEERSSRLRFAVLLAVCVLVPVAALVLASRDGGSGAEVDGGDGSLPREGDVAPTFVLDTVDGGRVSLADYAGRPVVLTFLASWCHPCEQEIPHLDAALDRHADAGLAVIGVAYRDLERDTRAFLDRLDASFPTGVDPDGTVAEAFGVLSIPVTFFIGADGTVADVGFGLTEAEDVEDRVDAMLAS